MEEAAGAARKGAELRQEPAPWCFSCGALRELMAAAGAWAKVRSKPSVFYLNALVSHESHNQRGGKALLFLPPPHRRGTSLVCFMWQLG